jgi:hypothetical protein
LAEHAWLIWKVFKDKGHAVFTTVWIALQNILWSWQFMQWHNSERGNTTNWVALFQSRVPIWPVALEVGSTPQIKHRAFYRNRQQQCLYRWNVTNSYFKSDNLASLLKLINGHWVRQVIQQAQGFAKLYLIENLNIATLSIIIFIYYIINSMLYIYIYIFRICLNSQSSIFSIENLHVRLILDLGKKSKFP